MDNENQRELDVLAALEGIHRMQESIRDTELDIVVETGIIFLRLHYQRLPPGVARRLTKITPEQIGVFKTLKIAIELDKFLRRLEAEGRKQYTIGELFDEVFFPVWKL